MHVSDYIHIIHSWQTVGMQINIGPILHQMINVNSSKHKNVSQPSLTKTLTMHYVPMIMRNDSGIISRYTKLHHYNIESDIIASLVKNATL